ncbi:hypothetical protein K4F84_10480 [Phaeobacter inhibens]|uniref:luciferase domain-containing protein n=1 Tax=Phaeobacter inhibens TaxID=221822 RepID=UPI0021A77AD2|nr:hypothetical protein [Phaeobacter inhibens]UWR51643.1 hypothetical protein K4F84_10480 [Phaeobacter inhibens]
MSKTLNLPKRVGPKPDTTHGLPHSQVTQHGPDHIVDQMREWAFSLPCVEKGWGEHHTLVLAGRRPVGLVMVFSPRDEAELDTIKTILSRSYEAVTAQKIAA